MAFVDRQALALLVQPIKRDLHVSDTAMSMLYGLSFTLFYVLVGIPIARLADRSNRRTIIAASVFVWSIATATCGMARSYGALFAARVGVGAGEAGLSPAAYSLLADYFPREKLPTAMGVYVMGTYVGGALALIIGGLLSTVVPPSAMVVVPLVGAVKGWQLVFLALGVPGVLLAAAMRLIKEPARRGSPLETRVAPLSAFFAHVGLRKRAYLGIGLGFALMIFVGNGTGAWIPAFFERRFGWSTADIGHRYGLIVFFCGTAGALAGGVAASWLQRRSVKHGNLVAAIFGFSALIPVTIAFPLVGNPYVALALIGAMNFFAGFNFGGGLASLQDLTPNRMRALLSAGYMLTVNLIGGVLGPMAVALITDHVFHDPAKLHLAIAMSCAVASPLALICLLIGVRGVRATETLGDA
ncbi:MFS transporter [Sphingomonas populi]|uniref:MFS transporter n=2 Tax=Sphingomonas populi TaxID=2484750 RepID=A0A4Q6Y2Z2_9SPHN|nr:MFS transporter [Sphingomonas populi]